MFIRVSPKEKEHVFKVLDKQGVQYVKEEVTAYVCNICERIYKDKPEKCCDAKDFETVQLGDIVGENYNFCLERKDKLDLLDSIMDGRIYDQLKRMAEIFRSSCALVFEGRFEDVIEEDKKRRKKLGWEGTTNYAQLYSIPATCTQYGVSFIQVKDMNQLLNMIKYFDYKCGTEPKFRTKRKNIYKTMPNIVQRLVELPGFGLKMALDIAKEYSSLGELIFDLAEDRMRKVQGIGKGRKNKLKELLLS